MSLKKFRLIGKKLELFKIITLFKHIVLIIFLLSNTLFSKVLASDNYVLSTVNKLPITKIDVLNKAKLLSFLEYQDLKFKKLKNFYDQSFKTLVDERIIESAGLQINKNINKIVLKQAYQLTLQDFENSEYKFKQFVNKLSIPKSTIIDKFKNQLIWNTVLRDRFKLEIKNIEKKSNEIFNKQEVQNKKNLYDLAEIVIKKRGNTKLLKNVTLALKQGASFLDIAKQISISNSAQLNGKIGWKTYENLPTYIIDKKIQLKEGDIISFPVEDKIRIIKVLVKRNAGRLSKTENNILLAQINFKINFQTREIAYFDIKEKLTGLLNKKINCNNLKNISNKNNQDINLKVITTRIADLSPNIQKVIKNINLYEVSNPIYDRNKGQIYIKCDVKKAKLVKNISTEIKNKFIEKQFLILSEKLIKKLKQQANIINIKKLNN